MSRIRVYFAVFAFLALGALGGEIPSDLRAIADALPTRDVDILLRVGREYGLTGDSLKLLLVIRKIENGGPGKEMGVASGRPGHPSRRFAGKYEASLDLQGRWAAGTIARHYTGDLEKFARRYCPPKWTHWTKMARQWMKSA